MFGSDGDACLFLDHVKVSRTVVIGFIRKEVLKEMIVSPLLTCCMLGGMMTALFTLLERLRVVPKVMDVRIRSEV